MSSAIVTSGMQGRSFRTLIRNAITKSSPNVIGVAVAYVSVGGFNFFKSLADGVGVEECRLVTDIRDAVTHPNALKAALNDGWDVRVVGHLPGTFHPKLYVGAQQFDHKEGVKQPCLIIAGSANLSISALTKNGECSYIRFDKEVGASSARSWKECWDTGKKLTAPRLAAYEKYFANRNRFRSPADLIALGVADDTAAISGAKPTAGISPPKIHAASNSAASVSWAGLQSFTGDYDLQVEFPKDAGIVLARMLKGVAKGDRAKVLCDDGVSRDFLFKFYGNNGMWRLNVSNDTPNAAWARQHKDGIATVEIMKDGKSIEFKIIKPGSELNDVVNRSVGLGSWGKTSKRLYGWY